ncbi:MAG: T9SS type A sorting domain-containing protein [Candidatus Latescibacterota bacterium]|nr:MAG: T9SS type A sorting domain-containing protein [Candidatus Latescibacterota bacterium]
MRPAFGGLVFVLVLGLVAAPAIGQTGKVTVYFEDDGELTRAIDCPGPGFATLHVIAEDWDINLVGLEFRIDYPSCMTWLGDMNTPPVTIGDSPSGISMGWGLPFNGYEPFEVMRAFVSWNCTDCSVKNHLICVEPHPVLGEVCGVRFPDFELVPGEGRCSAICPFVDLDIKPLSCPNPFNSHLFQWAQDGSKPRKGGVLPVAILGSETFDVGEIDLSSIRLEGIAPLDQGGGPKIRDVAAGLVDPVGCECTEDGPDGYPDVMMKFRSQDIAGVLGAGTMGVVELTATGTYLDGIPFEATDCIKVVGGKEPMMFESVTSPVLKHVYPNPFNPVTTITFLLPETDNVRLAVYDVSGRLVEVLVDGTREAGEHVIEWEAASLPSGVYFARLEAEGETQVKRLTLLK